MSGFGSSLRLLLLLISLLMSGQARATAAPALHDLAVLVDSQGDIDIAAVAGATDQRFKPAASAINHTDNIEAGSLTQRGGRIVLDAGPRAPPKSSAASAPWAKNVGLFEQARFDAGGATGSGTVLVGGTGKAKTP